MGQTMKNFSFYEINYGGDNYSVLHNYTFQKKLFWSKKLPTYADAMNTILDLAFKNCDIVFNVNLDDYYHSTRFEKQIQLIVDGCDLVSSDFCYISDNNGQDTITHYMNINITGDIGTNLNAYHNVIAHPCVAYSKTFWNRYKYYDPTKVPAEDLDLWLRAYNNGAKFKIHDDILLYYRIHNNQISTRGDIR